MSKFKVVKYSSSGIHLEEVDSPAKFMESAKGWSAITIESPHKNMWVVVNKFYGIENHKSCFASATRGTDKQRSELWLKLLKMEKEYYVYILKKPPSSVFRPTSDNMFSIISKYVKLLRETGGYRKEVSTVMETDSAIPLSHQEYLHIVQNTPKSREEAREIVDSMCKPSSIQPITDAYGVQRHPVTLLRWDSEAPIKPFTSIKYTL